jgi:hypothetical protein
VLRYDRRAAWSYRLLHAQGPSAVVRPPDEERMTADGMTPLDIAAVRDHLAMLRINNLAPTRHGILQKRLDANGAPANAINLAMAQDVYFRGMWMALSQSERRYGGHIVEADDFMEQVFRERVRPAPAVSDVGYAVPASGRGRSRSSSGDNTSGSPCRGRSLQIDGRSPHQEAAKGETLDLCVLNIRFGIDAENRRGKLAT